MIIMVNKGVLGERTITYKQYFEDNQLLTMNEIANWDDVVDNLKDKKVREQVTLEGVLRGNEYPWDTPITEERN